MSKAVATAAIIVIGNEILSGKVQDANSPYLCRELRFLGVDLQCILTIPDDAEIIGRKVREYSELYTWIYTSGGIGSTPDDLTIPAIAAGFGVTAVESPEMAELIRAYYKDQLTEAHLRMALIPEGAVLLKPQGLRTPQVQFHNIFIFPGIPEFLKERFNAIKEMFRQSPIFLTEILLRIDESLVAEALNQTLAQYSQLLLGSYPALWNEEYTLKLTLESRDKVYLRQALDFLMERLPQEKVLQVIAHH